MGELLSGERLEQAGLEPMMAKGLEVFLGPPGKSKVDQAHIRPTNVVAELPVVTETDWPEIEVEDEDG